MVHWLLSFATPVAHASLDTFIRKINTYILNPVIVFLFTLAVVYFIYGVYEYVRGAGESDAREQGQKHMLWGLIGLSIMVAVFFIIRVMMGTIGIDENEINPQTGEVNIILD